VANFSHADNGSEAGKPGTYYEDIWVKVWLLGRHMSQGNEKYAHCQHKR